jgi:hypothetical protein
MSNFSYIAPNIVVGNDPSQSVQQMREFGQDRYKADVLDTLQAIWDGSWTGTAVIQAIAEKSGTKVVISPFLNVTCNSESNARPDWAKAGEINIRFTPADWSAGSCGRQGPGATPDAVLLHELVHAYRQIQGHTLRVLAPVPGFIYEDEHEFYAILLANIHLSAKNQRVLRRDHKGYKVLYPELASSEPFLTNLIEHRRLVENFVNENGALCNTVRRDQCVFNPIDYFLKNRFAMVELNKHRFDPMVPVDLAAGRAVLEQAEKMLRGQ